MIEIFEVVDGELQLCREEIRLHKPFNDLLVKDKGMKGDSDGRKKLYTFEVFKFMHLMYHPDEHCIQQGLLEKDAKAYCFEHTNVDKDIFKDPLVNAAITYYKELVYTQTQRTLADLRISLSVIKNGLSKLTDSCIVILESGTTLTVAQMKEVIDIQNIIFSSIDTLGAKLRTINDLEKQVMLEKKPTDKVGRGGVEIEFSQNPDTAY